MEKKIFNPWKWQDDMGFAQAVEVRNAEYTLYCAGQTSVDENGTPQHPKDMGSQINLAFDNLEKVLSHSDYKLENVVKINYFTTDMGKFYESFGNVMERTAAKGCIASGTLVEVSKLAYPELMIEVEAIAVK
ncbi:MAG: RidA family protein [Ignavibacteria bacterium]|nr:RidA family protein [Ignavibacteria bacterium]